MVAIKDILVVKFVDRPPKPLCKMTDRELEAIIRKNAELRTKNSNFPQSSAYLNADTVYHNARRVLDMRHGEYPIPR